MEEPPTPPVVLVPDSMPISFTEPGTIEIAHFSDGQWIPHDVDEDLLHDCPDVGGDGQDNPLPQERHVHPMSIRTEGPAKDRSMPPSQHAPKKVIQFARPASSHQDLASGFTFAKPKPAQSIDLGSKFKQTIPSDLSESAKSSLVASSRRQAPHVPLPLQDDDAGRRTPRDKVQISDEAGGKISSKDLNVPFPMIMASAAETEPCVHTESETSAQHLVDAGPSNQDGPPSDENAISNSDEATLVEAHPDGSPAQEDTTKDVANVQDADRKSLSNNTDHQNLRSHRMTRTAQNARPHAKTPSWLKSQDDVIHMLMFSRQKNSEEFQRLAAAQEIQKRQIIELHAVKENLNSKLQHAYERLEEKELESKERSLLKTRVLARVKKFNEFLNNLSQNHSQLRDTGYQIADDTHNLRADALQNQADLQKMEEAVSTTQETIKRERGLWTREISQSENQVNLLQQQVRNLQEKLQREQTLLSQEHARSQQLEESFKQASAGFAQLMNGFENHKNEISKHIAHLLDNLTSLASSNPTPIDPTPVLEKCVRVLEVLRDRDNLQPTDLHLFEDSLKEDQMAILGSIQACKSTVVEQVRVSQQMAQQIDDSWKKELQGLSSVVLAQQPHHKHVLEIQAARAAIQERLQAREAALQNAQTESAVLKKREEESFLRIANLSDQVLQMKAQPAIAAVEPEIYHRLFDLEARNKDLDEQRTAIQTESSAILKQLHEKNRDVETANNQVACVQLQLEETQARCNAAQKAETSLKEQLATHRCQKESPRKGSVESMNVGKELAGTQQQPEHAQSKAQVPLSRSSNRKAVQVANVDELEEALHDDERYVHTVDAELQKERNENLMLQRKVSCLDQGIRDALAEQNKKDKEIAYLKAALKQPPRSYSTINRLPHARSDYFESLATKVDSQIEEVPGDEEDFAESMAMYHNDQTQRPTQPRTPTTRPKPVTEETMTNLLVSTPEGRKNMPNDSAEALSGRQLVTYQRTNRVQAMHQVEDSQSENRGGPASISDIMNSQEPKNTSCRVLSNAPTATVTFALDDITAQNTVTNAQGAKSNTKIARKRSVTTADLAGPDEVQGPRKMTRSSSRISGSIEIADSQLQELVPSQTSRPTKLSTTQKKGSKRTGKYQKEFNKHLQPRNVAENH